MRISQVRISNFKSFGPNPTTVKLDEITYLLGPNGAGKTALLEALARLFSPVASQRKIYLEDFHVPQGTDPAEVHGAEPQLWIEADLEFPEAADDEQRASVPPFFAHMAIAEADGVPRVRVRLTARIALDLTIEESVEYVLDTDIDDEPVMRSTMSRLDRASVEVHYLPARRDPADHLSFTANSLIGRMLRAVDWTKEREALRSMSEALSGTLTGTAAVKSIAERLASEWAGLHQGKFFSQPSFAFGNGDLEAILRQLTVTFTPTHDGRNLPFERLSDGQKSLLYISLVLAWQALSRRVLSEEEDAFDPHRLRPAVHTVIALEEPENSLAPHYLGRISKQLREASGHGDVQSLIATHSPSMLRRVAPEKIRFLRLSTARETFVRTVVLPKSTSDSAKYVREAIQAHPELYFARLVILGEGHSEQNVLPRVLAASGVAEDDASVCVVPLGGRHVNHFWRLLGALEIPHVTLLDLDFGRFHGGWGRVRYALNQYNKLIKETFKESAIAGLPVWDDETEVPSLVNNDSPEITTPIAALEKRGVFFSSPIDIDHMMMRSFPQAYSVTPVPNPSEKIVSAVLGGSAVNIDKLSDDDRALFADYDKKFLGGSKPVAHFEALASLENVELKVGLPEVLERLVVAVQAHLAELTE